MSLPVVGNRTARLTPKPTQLRPLVLTATRRALVEAAELLPGRPLEVVVGEAIAAGRISETHGSRSLARVHVTPSVVVLVARTTSPLTGRRAWRPLILVKQDGRAAGTRDRPCGGWPPTGHTKSERG